MRSGKAPPLCCISDLKFYIWFYAAIIMNCGCSRRCTITANYNEVYFVIETEYSIQAHTSIYKMRKRKKSTWEHKNRRIVTFFWLLRLINTLTYLLTSYLLTFLIIGLSEPLTYLLTYFLLKYDKIGTTIQIERSQHLHSSVRQTDSCTEPVQTAAVAQKGP